ncbi:GGDEF domain-containing protein, partial [Caballeronia sp. LZ025]|nr:GGDEF domain-containing protein [Caballeronia sp. LZ025]
IGFAHRSDFCGHFGAAWHKEVALFEFLQPRAKMLADEALYAAKRGGRNRVAHAGNDLHVQPG